MPAGVADHAGVVPLPFDNSACDQQECPSHEMHRLYQGVRRRRNNLQNSLNRSDQQLWKGNKIS